ncbi:MAG: phosphoribosylformylglycinamidine cyclo-ligase, partial [Flavobacteriales bacterium]
MEERYSRRGVSATKSEVHRAVRHLNKGLFPNAFCKILPDIASGHPDYCNIMHSDTAGTKTS